MITLKMVLDELMEGREVDKALIDRVYRYHINYLNQSREYLEFFAGNLLGVQVVRFTLKNIRDFFGDVLGLDVLEVERAIRTVTTIDHTRAISSDPMNLMIMYLIHRFLSSPKLSEKERIRGAYDAALIFFYRALAIRQSQWFHFAANRNIAQAAYARLSNKFLLKQLGSWKAVLEYRAKELINEEGIHYKQLVLFQDDDRISYAVGDSENRIKSMYKYYYREFAIAVNGSEMISTSSATIVDAENIEKLKEKFCSVDKAITLLRHALHDRQSFIKPELVKVITDINTNTSQRMLVSVLEWMSENSSSPANHAKIDDFTRLVVVHSYHLVNEMGAGELNDVPMVLVTLKNLYLSTRSRDVELTKIRKLGEAIVKQAAGKINSSLLMATRTSVILYLTLRTFAAMK